jgi:hypothetical protein
VNACADCGRREATHIATDGEGAAVCRPCLAARWRHGFEQCGEGTLTDWLADLDSRLIATVRGEEGGEQ